MHLTKNTLLAVSLVTLMTAGFGAAAQAAVSQKDVEVAARTFGFINGIPAGEVEVMVIYDAANPASKADADAAMAALGGVKTAKHSFKPVLTPSSGIGASKVAYVTTGQGAAAGSAAAAKGIFTFTTDQSCVAAKQCAMYATATPAVTIEVSRTAIAAAKFEMAQALKMMVKEVE